MQIAYATIYDLRDVRRGSGTYHYLAKELERQGHVIHYLGPFEDIGLPILTRALKKASRAFGKRYRSWQDPFMGHRLGGAVERKLASLDFDVLLTNDYTIAAYTRTAQPMVLYSDSMFPLDYQRNTHPYLVNLSLPSVFFCQRVARLGLRHASLCFFPASRTLREALKYNEIKEDCAGLIPFGANLETPNRNVIANRLIRKNIEKGCLDLLFVGKNWVGKGGDVAVEAVTELNRRGFKAHLHVVGSQPARNQDPINVTLHGLLDKTVPAHKDKLAWLFANNDALILPTLGEGFGIVTVEAAAYGLPTLSYRCQGITDAVKEGETGILLPTGATGAAFADAVAGWFAVPESYTKMAYQAREYFEKTTNWGVAAAHLITKISARLTKQTLPVPGTTLAGNAPNIPL